MDKEVCFIGRSGRTQTLALKAELNIQVASRNEKTFLKTVFHTPPFRLANVTEDRSQKTLRLMMMSSSPGILDGDEYKIKIELEEGSSVLLETQSYQRLFQMKASASQQMEVRMEKDSAFVFFATPISAAPVFCIHIKNQYLFVGTMYPDLGRSVDMWKKIKWRKFSFFKIP